MKFLTEPENVNNVKIITWNANSIKNKMKELNFVLGNNKVDILGIVETKIDEKYSLKAPNYEVYRSDRNDAGGGVEFLIHKNIKSEIFNIPKFKGFEAVASRIFFQNFQVVIIVVYIPPKNKIFYDDFNRLFHLHSKLIVMGDFNAKRIEWNCFSSNGRGNNLLNVCMNRKINIAFPEKPTHYPTRGKPSIIAFFLIKNIKNTSKPVAFDIFSSDHNPVGMKLFEKPLR